MCLKYIENVDLSCGVGFKAVRKSLINPNGYYSFYPCFFHDGSGGTFRESIYVSESSIKYNNNELSFAKPQFISVLKTSSYRGTYRNGIHIYKKYTDALKEIECVKDIEKNYTFVIVKCFYIGAHAQDNNTIVADAIAILDEISFLE